jgi:predicted secreted protein
MRLIDVRESGERHHASVGDELVLRVVEPSTTGYRWQLVRETGPQLEVLEDGLEAGEPGAQPAGAAAHRTFRLAARAPGSTRVILELRRPWQSNVVDLFDVEVTVT